MTKIDQSLTCKAMTSHYSPLLVFFFHILRACFFLIYIKDISCTKKKPRPENCIYKALPLLPMQHFHNTIVSWMGIFSKPNSCFEMVHSWISVFLNKKKPAKHSDPYPDPAEQSWSRRGEKSKRQMFAWCYFILFPWNLISHLLQNINAPTKKKKVC